MQGSILLVDDDRDFAEGLAELLGLEGFDTALAFSKPEALDRNREFRPDIAILDIRLGKEDGLSLIEALRARNPDLQCIMLTGFAALNTAVDAVRFGAQDYLMKPVERDHLRAVLDRCMRMRTLIDAEAGAREALAQSEERYRLLTELSPVGVFQTDPQGGYSMVNPRWRELTGMTEENAHGRGWQEALHEADRDRVVESWNASIAQRRPFTAEFRLRADRGSATWVLAQALPRLIDGDEVTGYIGTLTDVTVQKEMDRRLADARRGQALESVAGGIAHHMNNALQIVTGYIHLTKEHTDDSSEARRILDLTSRGLVRLSGMTKDLLHFTGATVFDFSDVDPNVLISDLRAQFIYSKDDPVFFDLNLAGDLWKTRSEANRLNAALGAIIENAVEAMKGDGTLSIRTANRAFDEETAALAPGNYVEITFRDTGPGMSDAVAERAFEPFFTTKGPQSTGLGLSMAQGIIRKSGGVLTLYSTPGDGTTVTIYLPKAD